MNISETIHKRRKDLGLTLEDIATAVGVAKGTVQKWESGFIANIKRDKIMKLSEILDISPLLLINDDAAPIELTSPSGTTTYKVAAKDGIPGVHTVTVDNKTVDKLTELIQVARDLTPEQIDKLIKMVDII